LNKVRDMSENSDCSDNTIDLTMEEEDDTTPKVELRRGKELKERRLQRMKLQNKSSSGGQHKKIDNKSYREIIETITQHKSYTPPEFTKEDMKQIMKSLTELIEKSNH